LNNIVAVSIFKVTFGAQAALRVDFSSSSVLLKSMIPLALVVNILGASSTNRYDPGIIICVIIIMKAKIVEYNKQWLAYFLNLWHFHTQELHMSQIQRLELIYLRKSSQIKLQDVCL
jgi:hypothetical protein